MGAVAVCIVALCLGLLAVFGHRPLISLWWVLFILLWLCWLAFGRRGYKRRYLDASPGPTWVRTQEKFVDTRSGSVIAVYYDPITGERAYVRETP